MKPLHVLVVAGLVGLPLAACGDGALDPDATVDADGGVGADAHAPLDAALRCEPDATQACDCESGVPGTATCSAGEWGACACPDYGRHVFVSPGASGGDGTLDAPLGTLEEARDLVRALEGLPAGGVAIWLRGGVYERRETLRLTEEDAGEAGAPIAWRAFPGETVRITGGTNLSGGDFRPVDSDSPVWDRLDESARGRIVQIDLGAAGIADFGALARRGFCRSEASSPLEVSVDGEMMTLARWPDADAAAVDATGESIEVFGALTPDVTGTYLRVGESDGVSAYRRDGLVDGQQYYLRRVAFDRVGDDPSAWFLSTAESGLPNADAPWWARYHADLGVMSPGNGARGLPDFVPSGTRPPELAYVASGVSSTAFTYEGDRPSRWTEATDPWFHGWWSRSWADCRLGAASIDTATRTVTLTGEPSYGEFRAGQPYYAFNLLEEITVPGEYYLDRSSGVLYLYPPRPLAGAEVVVSELDDYLLDLDGASHVELHDVTLESGRTQLVRVHGGSDNLLVGVTLRNGGGIGVSLSGTRNGIRDCTVHDTATIGVRISGGERASLTPSGNFVENCHIHHFGRTEWTYRAGVALGGVGNRVENNLIHSAPHSAILFDGNDHLIARNEIHDVCEYSSDAGAVYSGRSWSKRGTLIEHNFIHHLTTRVEGHGVHAIYMDDCLSGNLAVGNVLYAATNYGILHGGGRDVVMVNNLMVGTAAGVGADDRCFSWRVPRGRPNTTPGDSWNLLEDLQRFSPREEPWASTYPAAAAMPTEWSEYIAEGSTWLYPEGSRLERNLGFNNRTWVRESGEPLSHYASVANNVEDADPLFVDEPNLDLSLAPESPARAIPGFEEIPFDAIGLQPRR